MRSTNGFLRIALDLDLDLAYLNAKYPGVSSKCSAKLLRTLVGPLRGRVLHHAIRVDRARAARLLSRLPELQRVFIEYNRQSQSARVKVNDYVRLYWAIRNLKPTVVLECGTGLSTTAIGVALKHNHEAHEGSGICISMEESTKWCEHAQKLLPRQIEEYVRIIVSPKVEKEHNGLRGVCYESIPDQRCEFVFVDGPTESSPVTGEELFDMDLIHIAQKNPSVQAFIDHRLNTIRCLKKALQQTHHVTYNPITKLGHVYPKARYKRARILVADK